MKIEKVKAEYTGGGIYCFMGKLEDNYFLADCDMMASWYDLRIINVDPELYDSDDVWDDGWQTKHFVKDVCRCKTFMKDMFRWIINNRPDGNYLVDDIEDMLRRLQKGDEEDEV